MSTSAANSTRRFLVDVVDTDSKFHEITVFRADWRGVKTEARKIAKERGIAVKFINGFFLAD